MFELITDHIKRPFPPLAPSDKQALITRISSLLRGKGCILAVLFGSFLDDKPFRDIDICVALRDKRPATPADLLYLAQLLRKETGYPFDVISTDVPNLPLRAWIARQGYPVLLEDEEFRDNFRFRLNAWEWAILSCSGVISGLGEYVHVVKREQFRVGEVQDG